MFETFESILFECHSELHTHEVDYIKVYVSSSIERKEEAEVDLMESISLANELFKVKTISYEIKVKVTETFQTPTAA